MNVEMGMIQVTIGDIRGTNYRAKYTEPLAMLATVGY